MAFNTYPYSPFPASTEQLHKGDNEEMQEQIGKLSNLETEAKTSVVAAVNEVNGNADTNTASIGDLSNLETENKTSVVAAVNELKSGLTNVDVALSVPEGTGKNVLPMTLDSLKARNTSGTWVNNVYTLGNVSCTVNTDSTGAVTSLQTTAASTGEKNFVLYVDVPLKKGSYILSSGFSETYSSKDTFLSVSGTVIARGNNTAPGQSFSIDATTNAVFTFRIKADGDITAFPMIRRADVSDPTYAPYIPSVEARLEAVENGEYKVIASVAADGVKTYAELFIGLYNFVDGNKCYLSVGNIYYNFVQKSAYHAFFSASAYFNGVTSLYNVDIQANAANYVKTDIASNGTVTVTDKSSDVPTNGTVIKLVR